jgi:hypothetical protein
LKRLYQYNHLFLLQQNQIIESCQFYIRVNHSHQNFEYF